MRRPFGFPRAALFFSMTALLAACGSTGGGTGGTTPAPSANRQLSFGVDMARQELWSEALFRFHQAEALDPQNPRIQNNLAVAYEATGDFENALKHYQQALRLDPNNRDLRANWTRFSQFYSAFTQQKRAQAGQPAQPGAAAAPPTTGAAEPATPPTAPTIGQPSPTPSLAQPPQTAPVQPPVDSQPDQNPPPPPPPADPSNAPAVP